MKKERDYKEGTESTNGNNEALLLKNIKLNIRDSLNMLEGKNRKENIKKLKEKTKHGTVSS